MSPALFLLRALLVTGHRNASALLITLLGHSVMYLIVIAWLYVVLMAALVEATSSVGTVLGAVITFVLYGLLPLSIVMYILGTPGRKRALYAQAMAERAALVSAVPHSAAPDADGEASTGAPCSAVSAVREEA